MLLGVDTGGTFTDFVLYRDGHISIHKVLSTPNAPEQAILQGIPLSTLVNSLLHLPLRAETSSEYKLGVIIGLVAIVVNSKGVLIGKPVTVQYLSMLAPRSLRL